MIGPTIFLIGSLGLILLLAFTLLRISYDAIREGDWGFIVFIIFFVGLGLVLLRV